MKFPSNRFITTEREQGITLVLITMFLFVIHDVISKHLTPYYSVYELLGVRYMVHVIFMLVMLAPRMRMRLIKTRRPVLQLVRALFMLASSALFMLALRYIPLADATAIHFVAPLLLVAFSAPLLGEKVESRSWIAVVMGFCGVLIIVRPGGGLLHLAAFLPLASACCSSLYQIITRKFRGSENPATTHFITGLTGFVVMPLACWQSDAWITPTLLHALLMLGMGLVVSFGHYLLIESLHRIGPAVAAPFSYTQFLWALLFGMLIFGDTPDAISLLGCAIIIVSGIYLARSQNRR